MNDTQKPLIGLIHSTRLVVDPVHQVVAAQCPDAEIINIVDEGILKVLFSFGTVFFLDFAATSVLPLHAFHTNPFYQNYSSVNGTGPSRSRGDGDRASPPLPACAGIAAAVCRSTRRFRRCAAASRCSNHHASKRPTRVSA